MAEQILLVFRDRGHGKDTPGKRTPIIKALGRSIQEWEFNDPVSDMMGEELKRAGVHVVDVAPTDRDTPLKERVDYANKIYYQYCAKYGRANVKAVYISIHFNALDGTFEGADPSGFSVHIYKGHKTKDAGRLANCIIDELKNGTKQINRGVVEQDLYVTRETAMVAALSENGFMDNQTEANLMLNKDFQKEVAIEHAKGICKYFGIPYVAEQPPAPQKAAEAPKATDKGIYIVRIFAGSKAGADRVAEQARKAGYKDAYVELKK